MNYKDQELFTGKNFSGLVEEIYNNAIEKKHQIDNLILALSEKIDKTDPKYVRGLMLSIKDCFDVSVRNDDNLVKIAAIMQKIQASEDRLEATHKRVEAVSGNTLLTDEEKKELLALRKDTVEIHKQTEEIIKKVPKIN